MKNSTLPNAFCEVSATWYPKPNRDITVIKDSHRPISLRTTEAKILNLILADHIQQHRAGIIHQYIDPWSTQVWTIHGFSSVLSTTFFPVRSWLNVQTQNRGDGGAPRGLCEIHTDFQWWRVSAPTPPHMGQGSAVFALLECTVGATYTDQLKWWRCIHRLKSKTNRSSQ